MGKGKRRVSWAERTAHTKTGSKRKQGVLEKLKGCDIDRKGRKVKRRAGVREMNEGQIMRGSDVKKCSGQFRTFSFETCLSL